MANIVILGLGAAGFGAALAAKKQDRSSKITIIDNKDFDLMHQCGLPFVLDKEIKDFSNLKHDLNLDKMGIRLISNSKISKIDFNDKKVQYEKDDKNEEISYDKLIIATGSKPFTPEIKTENNIFTIHTINDTKELEKNIKNQKKAIVIGAGAIGLETAVALKKMGLDVTVKDMLPSTFPKAIDKDISEIVEEKLKSLGIKLELGKKIEEIKENALVVMATGVKPNIDFLKDSKLKIDKGIVVDEKMQTSIKGVYAIGDCCSVRSLINKENWTSILANNAYKQGTVAGANAAGGKKAYKGILGTFVSVIDNLEIAATGFNSFLADHYKIKKIVGKAKGKSRPEWFGKADELTVKIIADEKGRIIGAQAVGKGAKERINIISTAIKAKMALEDISNLELAYCPAVSDYYDVLVMAADLGLRRLKQ